MYVVKRVLEIFGGQNLARILRRGHEMEGEAIRELENNDMARCLSIHTNMGTPSSLTSFLNVLSDHVPSKGEDWFASLRVEGASAVWAAVDLLCNFNKFVETHIETR